MKKQPAQTAANCQIPMHDLFYCPTTGDDAERCLALAAALRNAPDFVLLEQVFAPEADIFCFIFLPVRKPFGAAAVLVPGQPISGGEHGTAAETAALEAAVNRIAEKAFQTAKKS